MKFQLFLISVLYLFQISNCQLSLKATIDDVDAPRTDEFVTTANGRYLIHSKSTSIYKIYDLTDGNETEAEADNRIYNFVTIPNTDKILDFSSLGFIEIFTLPDLTKETIVPTGSVSSNSTVGKSFFSVDGNTLYIVGDESIQSIDFSNDSYTVSEDYDFSYICSSINQGLVQQYPYPKGNKVAIIDQDYNTCVVDYSDMNNLVAEEGQHTEDAGTKTAFGILQGELSVETNDNNYAQVLVFNLLSGQSNFTYTFGTKGAYSVHNGILGNYWAGQLYSKEFIVVNGENLCQYQATPKQFSKSKSGYWFDVNNNVLVITENSSKIYVYDIGTEWQQMDKCTSSSAQLGNINYSGLTSISYSVLVLALLAFLI